MCDGKLFKIFPIYRENGYNLINNNHNTLEAIADEAT